MGISAFALSKQYWFLSPFAKQFTLSLILYQVSVQEWLRQNSVWQSETAFSPFPFQVGSLYASHDSNNPWPTIAGS